ncbi:MAG: hypothetical protein K6F32_02615 [Bacilli bacterium]|nr:hypothetical protein [Bacilli bacterium]
MKNIQRVLLSALLSLGLLSCGSSSDNSDYAKVKKAFDAVNSSFSSINRNARQPKALRGDNVSTDRWESLFSKYGKSAGTASEDISFSEPPIAQFNYMRLVYEKIGSGFEFGSKYKGSVTGTIYFDMDTGYKVDSTADQYKYDYTFVFGLEVNLLSDDLITMAVSFDIALAQGAKTYNTKWYVGMELDYDFDSKSTDYELSMKTANEEADLAYLAPGYTYEYDYVEFDEGKMDEWRKSYYKISEKVTKDSSHPTLSSYSGYDIEVGNQRWYDGNSYRRIDSGTADGEIAEILYGDLGLNSGDIKADAFHAKSGTESSAIPEVYRSISSSYGGDIIYDLVTREKHEQGGQGTNQANWPSDAIDSISLGQTGVVPPFASASSSLNFTHEFYDGTLIIRVSGENDSDWHTFVNNLLASGFESDGQESYVKPLDDDVMIFVMPVSDSHVIYIGTIADNPEEEKDPVDIPHGIDYEGAYAYSETFGYGSVNFNATKIYEIFLGDIPLEPIELNATWDSVLTGIRIDEKAAGESSISEAVNNEANFYAKLYSSWGKYPLNVDYLFYASQRDMDVAIYIEPDADNGYIRIYSMCFTKGFLQQSINHYWDASSSSSSSSTSTGEATTYLVTVHIATGDGSFSDATKSYAEGDKVDLYREFNLDSSKGSLYWDAGGNEPLGDGTVIIDRNIEVYYILRGGQSSQAEFKIYDIVDGEPVYSFSYYGNDGESIKASQVWNYALFTDEACTELVDPNSNITLDGVTSLYCRDYKNEAYLTLEVKLYLDDVLYMPMQTFVRKGRIYAGYEFERNVLAKFSSYFDSFTLKIDDKAVDLVNESLVFFANSDARLDGKDSNLKVYHLLDDSNGLVFDFVSSVYLQTGEAVHQPGKAKHYYITTIDDDGNVHYSRTRTFMRLKYSYAYKGEVIYTDEDYYENSDGCGVSFIFVEGVNDIYYKDVDLTEPYELNSDNEFIINGDATLYMALQIPSYLKN